MHTVRELGAAGELCSPHQFEDQNARRHQTTFMLKTATKATASIKKAICPFGLAAQSGTSQEENTNGFDF